MGCGVLIGTALEITFVAVSPSGPAEPGLGPEQPGSAVAACLGHVGTCPPVSESWLGPLPRVELPASQLLPCGPSRRARPRVLGRVVEGECGCQAPSPCVSPQRQTHTGLRTAAGSQALLLGKPCPWGRTSVLVLCTVLEPPGSSPLGRSRQACRGQQGGVITLGHGGVSGLGWGTPCLVSGLRGPSLWPDLPCLPSCRPRCRPRCLVLQPKKITLPS